MSQFSGGYAVAILQNGNVVPARQDGRVALPFGSDYVIRLINRNSKRAVAKVSIDGQNVSGGGVIIDGHGAVDLERPTDKAVTFRFASVDSNAAEAHGKAGPDTDGEKGLVVVEWRCERQILPYGTGYLGATARSIRSYNPPTPNAPNSSLHKSGVSASNSADAVACGQAMSFCGRETLTSGGISLPDVSKKTCAVPELQSGVTVEGQFSAQSFRKVAFDVDYAVPVIVTSVKLMGYVADEGVPRQGTNYCPRCSTTTKKPTDRYCRHCGEKLA